MDRPRVLITAFFVLPDGEVDRRLRAAGVETVFNHWHGGRTEEEMIDLLRGIDGVVASIDPFTRRVLEASPQLKVVSRTGVGYDAVDVPAATARGIAVCTTPGVNQVAVAEYAFTLMLACARRLPENLAEVPGGNWVRHEGRELLGSTLGIVGLGAIGKEVAVRARAFGMRVLANDLVLREEFADRHQIAYVPLEQLLRESDFVSLHPYLDARSRHLINAERLALMKPTAYLINTSRGGVVDTKALYGALQEKRIAGAALDVFEQEPLEANSPLRALDNVYLSPHAAGQTATASRAMGLMAADNVLLVLQGKPPLHAVNPEVLGNPRS